MPAQLRFALIAIVALTACDSRAPSSGAALDDGSTLYALWERSDCEHQGAAVNSASIEIPASTDPPPCRIALKETGIVIRGDSAGLLPDPGQHLARDSRGNFYTSIARSSAPIAVWNPDGSFNRTFGRAGEGPGEFRKSLMEPLVFVDRKDGVYVRHEAARWTVFTSDSAVVWQHQLDAQQDGAVYSAVLGDGGLVASGAPVGSESHFTVLRSGDSVARKFATVPPELRTEQIVHVSRSVVRGSDTTFWAGPNSVAGHGYRLEQWSASGNLLTTIQRRAEWFDETVVIDTAGPPPSTVQPRNVDQHGLLLTMSWVPNDEFWKIPGAKDMPPSDSGPQRSDIFVEIIDPASGVVLATEAVTLRGLTTGVIPRFFIPGTRLGYTPRRLPDGRTELHILEYRLVSGR